VITTVCSCPKAVVPCFCDEGDLRRDLDRVPPCLSRWQRTSSCGKPNGDDDPFPVQEATE
jgi:hypothetical protein